MKLYKNKECTEVAICPHKITACINAFGPDSWKYEDCLGNCNTNCAWCAQYNNTYFCSILNGFPPTVYLYSYSYEEE